MGSYRCEQPLKPWEPLNRKNSRHFIAHHHRESGDGVGWKQRVIESRKQGVGSEG